MRSIVSFRDVTVYHQTHLVLDRISFDLNMGEFVYLTGPTGSGKSTVLRLIYADLLPHSGQVRVNDQVPAALNAREIPFLRRKLGVVFQDFQLLPDRNVADNIYFALRATGWRDRRRIKQKITDVLAMVGLSGKAQTFPHQLSGGEQQRAAIARALINEPYLLVADEPTGNLDPEATGQVVQVLKRINLSGTAVLMATHDYGLIRSNPSRVLRLDNHRITEFARADAFLSRYAK